MWKMPDYKVIQRVTEELDDLNILSEEEICYSNLRKMEYAYVISDHNLRRNMHVIKNFLKCSEIDLVGRFAEYKYLNMDACVERAASYAKSLASNC